MKRKIVGICICMLVIATTLPVVGTLNKKIINTTTLSSSLEWEYTYGGDEFEWLYDIEPTRDGGYIATGITEENNVFYAWLLKVDANGAQEWSMVNYNFFGTSVENDIIISCVRQAPEPDDGYLVGGFGVYYNTYYGYWFVSGYLWKVNSSGVTEWLKPIVNEVEEWSYVPFVFENYDYTGWMCGGFYAKGNPTGYIMDVGLFKTDLDGNFLSGYHYDVGQNYNYEFTRSLWKTTDNGYFLSGSSLVNPSSNKGGFCMVKTDSNGVLQKDAIFDGPGFDYSAVMGCRQTDGGYIMSGLTSSYGAGGTDLWIIKTDADFNEQWNKTYGGTNNDRCYGMDATDDGGYVFAVIKNAWILTGTMDDTWIIITDSEGNLTRELLIEEDGTQWPTSIDQTDDGGFIVAGRTGPMADPASDGLILKIRPIANLDCKGTLKWTKVKAGSTVIGEFQVGNVGPEGSLLNWEIISKPTWGNWTFTPNNGTGLAAGSWVTVNVSVVAPPEKKTEFTGKVKISNLDSPDICEIDAYLKTPRPRTIVGFNLLQSILQKYPNMFPILRQVLA